MDSSQGETVRRCRICDDPKLAAFPYVNGGLFEDDSIEIPPFTDEIMALLLHNASEDFNWSEISPTIFGAVFESTLNPETRRAGGMHYTSLENIHKVIDPLFLDDLKEELEAIKGIKVLKTKRQKLDQFQDKLASLSFLDPAAGSGNFLTESFLCIRRLENEVIKMKVASKGQVTGQLTWGLTGINPIKVSISQFYGIEINDFAVSVARTALWIAESQMLKETEDIIYSKLDFLPLKTNAYIVEGNALRIDWNDVVPREKLNYIIGNPPFVGARLMDQGSLQKKEVQDIFGNIKDVQDLDYVTCWYKLAAAYIQNTCIEVCFVSTNSICQGSQVPILWNVLFNDFHVHINFAYQTFVWNSESLGKAAVHCIVVSFSAIERKNKWIYYDTNTRIETNNISPYLTPGSDVFVVASKENLWGMPKMSFGNRPRDGGFFILTQEERDEILFKDPELERWDSSIYRSRRIHKRKKALLLLACSCYSIRKK